MITKKTIIKTDDLHIYTETLTRHYCAEGHNSLHGHILIESIAKKINEILQYNSNDLSASTILKVQALKAKLRPRRQKFGSRIEKKKAFVRNRLSLTKGKIKRLQNLEKKLKKSLKYYEKKT